MIKKSMKVRTYSGTTEKAETKRELDNRLIAKEAAADGIVLLKNEAHILPLSSGCKVALYGVGASKTIKGGTGSGDVNERGSVSIYEGMENAGIEITTKEWVKDFETEYQMARETWRDDILEKTRTAKDASGFFGVYSTTPFIMPVGKSISKTDTDTAIYVLSRIAGEGADIYNKEGDFLLNGQEKDMLGDICSLYKKVIVVVNTGGVIDLSFMDQYENIYGLIQMVQAGMEGGNALADILLGRVTPCGKLTDTWARKYEDYPSAATFSHNNGNVQNERYEEGIYVGYRYFDSFDKTVRYEFGYGLSYTDFEITINNMSVSICERGQIWPEIEIHASVENIGNKYNGKEVVQIYVSCPCGNLEKEYRRLVAFSKTNALEPGETQEVTLRFSIEQLSSYCETIPGWILEKGTYGVWIGNSLNNSKLTGSLLLDQDVVLTKTKNICPIQEELKELRQDRRQSQKRYSEMLKHIEENKLQQIELHADEIQTESVHYLLNSEFWNQELKELSNALTIEQKIKLSIGDPGKGQGSNLGSAGISVPGSAGETHTCAKNLNLASIVLADGPAGLRLMQNYNVDKDGKIVTKPFQYSLEGGFFCPDEGEQQGTTYYQYCTALPVGTLLAQTWNLDLIRKVGEMIGREMEYFGVTLWLAPGMNIHRNPLCGRNFEYYSEDPYISGTIAAAMTEGVQSISGCGTTIKHFACNNQEDNRMGSNSILTERTLREVYLKGFEIAVKRSKPMSIMTSYNLINGIHAANNKDLCTNVARNEWGFDGVIMTDWTTTEKGEDCTASGCMRAGNDLVMPGCAHDQENIRKELEAGTLKEADLNACIMRLADVILRSNQYV